MKYYEEKKSKEKMKEKYNGSVVAGDGNNDDNNNNNSAVVGGGGNNDDNKNNKDDNKMNEDEPATGGGDIINVKLLMDWAQQYAPHRLKKIKKSLVAMCNDCTAPYGIKKSWYNSQLNIAKCVFKEHWERLHEPIYIAIMYVFILLLS